MNFKTLVILLLTAASTGQIFGYSWAIKNGTDKNLYIHLGTRFTNPIGKANKGVLIKPGEVTGNSEKLPNNFKTLIIADNESMTEKKVTFSLEDDHNINYTITMDAPEIKSISVIDRSRSYVDHDHYYVDNDLSYLDEVVTYKYTLLSNNKEYSYPQSAYLNVPTGRYKTIVTTASGRPSYTDWLTLYPWEKSPGSPRHTQEAILSATPLSK